MLPNSPPVLAGFVAAPNKPPDAAVVPRVALGAEDADAVPKRVPVLGAAAAVVPELNVGALF